MAQTYKDGFVGEGVIIPLLLPLAAVSMDPLPPRAVRNPLGERCRGFEAQPSMIGRIMTAL